MLIKLLPLYECSPQNLTKHAVGFSRVGMDGGTCRPIYLSCACEDFHDFKLGFNMPSYVYLQKRQQK